MHRAGRWDGLQFYQIVKERLSEKICLSRNLKEMRKQTGAIWSKNIPGRRQISAEALKQKLVMHGKGTTKGAQVAGEA